MIVKNNLPETEHGVIAGLPPLMKLFSFIRYLNNLLIYFFKALLLLNLTNIQFFN